MKMSLFLIAVLMFFIGCSDSDANEGTKKLSAAVKVNPETLTDIGDFTLPGSDGKSHTLSNYKSSKGIALIFVSTECPVSNAYNNRMTDIYNGYAAKGITILGINSNRDETMDEIKTHAADNGLPFVILKDEGNIVADKLGASVTPEVYLLDSNLKLVYHGRIDDSRRPEEVSVKDFQAALDELLAGRRILTPKTKAFGCTIKR